jgi:uncharacterized protein (TIGR02118 family)
MASEAIVLMRVAPHVPASRNGPWEASAMIKVSVFYPNSPDSTFDLDYYVNSHIPMVQGKLGAACTGVAVESGLGGGAPDAPATYTAMGHLYFDSVESFQEAFGPHAEAIMGDVPNYTNIEPVIQVSEVNV